MNFCNRREDRAHPGATVAPHEAGGRAPVTRLGVELPLHRSLRPDQASARTHERPARIEADTLVGQRRIRETRSGSRKRRAPRPAFDLPRERQGRRNEPGYLHVARNRDFFTAALRKLHRSRRRRPFFTRETAQPWTGHTAAPAAEKPAQWLSMRPKPTCLRRPNDVLRNVSPASRCAASFEFTLATRIVTIKPKTSSKRTFFVHRMCRCKAPTTHMHVHTLCELDARLTQTFTNFITH